MLEQGSGDDVWMDEYEIGDNECAVVWIAMDDSTSSLTEPQPQGFMILPMQA